MSTITSPTSYHHLSSPGSSRFVQSPESTHVARISSPSPSPPSSAQKKVRSPGLRPFLIPTDRGRDELEEKWLPRIGMLRVDREVELQGFTLYAQRGWVMSRTHFSQTIVTYTGRPTDHVTAYVLVPETGLAIEQGLMELARAKQILASQTQSHPRETDDGTLLVTTPSSFGQDVFSIPGGDVREVRPYLVVNNGLRRLGCGGRAVMGMESPIPAVRRKFSEIYLFASLSTNTPLSRATSPTTSPSKGPARQSIGGDTPQQLATEPFAMCLIELIKVIQSALLLWGMIDEEGMEIDGLFCDVTKKGILDWRRAMGMEHEESMKLEKETSGGCIDPKTLAALLSSVTSVRYQLDALDVERLPKDPFTKTKRFLDVWLAYQTTANCPYARTPYLTVPIVHWLNRKYVEARTSHPEVSKLHRHLLTTVHNATGNISANLKGGVSEETPLRQREHHLRLQSVSEAGSMGMSLIVSKEDMKEHKGEAPPDVITSDLAAYTKAILGTREKDLNVMGAGRLARLWSGRVGEPLRPSRRLDRLRMRSTSKEPESSDNPEANGHANTLGALSKVTAKTGQVLKGGLGLVSRRTTGDETSDSDAGGPGSTKARQGLFRRHFNDSVPLVLEPDLEEVEDQLDDPNGEVHHLNSPPRPGADQSFATSRPSYLSTSSKQPSKRPSITTVFSAGDDATSYRSDRGTSYRPRHNSRGPATGNDEDDWASTVGGLEESFLSSGAGPSRLRRSQSEHVLVDSRREEVRTGVAETVGQVDPAGLTSRLRRRRSLEDRTAYRDLRRMPVESLEIDVETCQVVVELRRRVSSLSQKAKDMKLLESSVFKATQDFIDAVRTRRIEVTDLESQAETVQKDLQKSLDDVDDDNVLQLMAQKIQYKLSEDTNLSEVRRNLHALRADWWRIKEEQDHVKEGRNGKVEMNGEEKPTKAWWRFGN